MRRILPYLCAIAVIVFTGWIEAHAGSWLTFDDSKTEKDITIDIIKSDVSGYKAKVTLHGLHDDIIIENGKKFHLLTIGDSHGSALVNVGEPCLPTITQLIAIPGDATYDISITERKWKDVQTGVVCPAQEDSYNGDPDLRFFINDSIYHQECYAPPLLKWSNEQLFNSIRCIGLRICPFRYYPLSGKLSVLTEFTVKIDFSETSRKTNADARDIQKANSLGIFDNDISCFPASEGMTKPSKSSYYYDYLIIVGEPSIVNSQSLKEFTEWKAFTGFKTKVVSTATAGTTADDIKDYIRQEQYSSGIKYVLLVGDQDRIPLKGITVGNLPTVYGDYWYGCLGGDSDFIADIHIGRFSTNSLSDFQKMVSKTIAYERFYDGNGQNVLLVAHKDFPNDTHYFQATSDTIRATHSGTMSFTTAYGAQNATNSDVTSHINSGMNVVNYNGHGDNFNWVGWNNTLQDFGSTQIGSITGTSVFFSIACNNGEIRSDPCMMESLTRSQNGAVACLAAVDSVWITPAAKYNKHLFSRLLVDQYRHLGELNDVSHASAIGECIPMSSDFAYKAKYDAYTILCGGDPTLRLWTGGPHALLSSDVRVLSWSDAYLSLFVAPITDYDISIVSEMGELVDRLSYCGHHEFFAIPPGNFYVVINKCDYFPYIMYFSSDGYIQNKTVYANSCYYCKSTPLSIGYDVDPDNEYGNVTVKKGSKLSIQNGPGGVTITNGFECENGAELTIE